MFWGNGTETNFEKQVICPVSWESKTETFFDCDVTTCALSCSYNDVTELFVIILTLGSLPEWKFYNIDGRMAFLKMPISQLI